MSFDYGGKALDSLDVAAYRADGEGEGGGREDDVFVMPSGGVGAKDLPVSCSGTRTRIVADLPAGEYMLDARARMPEGDASYGFRLIVEERETAAGEPPAFANVRFEPALPVDGVRRMASEHGVKAGMIEGRYRVGGEVHAWIGTGGLGVNFEKERLASFADITSGAGPLAPGEEDAARETSAMGGRGGEGGRTGDDLRYRVPRGRVRASRAGPCGGRPGLAGQRHHRRRVARDAKEPAERPLRLRRPP